jgi:hypothetical protein
MFRDQTVTILYGRRPQSSDFLHASRYANDCLPNYLKEIRRKWNVQLQKMLFSSSRCFFGHVINPRKLAAIQIATLGPTFAFANFAGTAILCLCFGAFILWRSISYLQITLGSYFVSLGINYLLMFLCALEIKNRESAGTEIVNELNRKQDAMAEYRRLSIYLLLPLVMPILALQRRYKSGSSQ